MKRRPNLVKKINSVEGRVTHGNYDQILIAVVFIILVFGLVMLSSASSAVAYSKFKSSYYYFNHQLFGIFLGIGALWFFSRVDYHIWQKYAFGFLVFSVFMLILVFIPGLSAHYGKARSWINIFGYSLQPSEFVKISFLLYLSAWLNTRQENLHDYKQSLGPFLAVLGLIGGLMLLQPDLGTLMIIVATSLIVYFAGGGKIVHILGVLAAGAVGFMLLVSFKPYQMDRIRCTIDPNYSFNDKCYQVNQSLIAVGSGGIFGRGLGESRQKFLYIPEVSSDSIYAVIGEEIGFIFSIVFLGLYSVLFLRGIKIAKFAPDGYGRILAIGIVSWIAIQVFVNIGGIINLMPMTGVPLPLVSYGGTAILSVMIGLGILLNISKQSKN